MDFTQNQRLAIDIRDSDVLVSASAGSGKTSVLVERVIGRITGKDPVDVDRMLIMTFTNAAASEMRERIRNTLDKRIEKLSKEGADEHILENLEKQSILVHSASISTIHGFCKSVITDHFDEASLDPDFRVADDSECKLLRQEALDECLERAYEKGDPQFLHAVSCYSDAKSDLRFAELIIPIYDFISADPDPEKFARESCRNYIYDSVGAFSESPIVAKFLSIIEKRTRYLLEVAGIAGDIIDEHEELLPYRACIESYSRVLSEVGAAIRSQSASGGEIYDEIRRTVCSASFAPFGRVLSKNLDEAGADAQEAVKTCRDIMKLEFSKIAQLLVSDFQTVYDRTVSAAPALSSLIDTVLDFAKIYEEKKREINVIDFNDMEHLALKILSNPDIAALYREKFVEIYVDEYQDTNMTQEVLVSLICRHDPGNVFQVGDVKQSIYGFRQARPDIFLSKYNSYSDSGTGRRRILLNDNFRSRREVVDSVNEVFSRIMHPDTGGIEYNESALVYGARCFKNALPCKDMTYRTEIIIGMKGDLPSEEMEANIIAGKILSMIRSGFTIYDKKSDMMRPVSFRDFTILVRSMRKFEPVFREVFSSAEIPLSVAGREGYFGTIEVQTALAFLSAVDNPFCDIPLATLMRSPAGGFSDTDMAELAVSYGSGKCLYERVRLAAYDEAGGELKGKCRKLVDLITQYKVMSTYTPVHGLLSDFIDRHYGDYVRCMSKGPQRMANLSMLLEKAEEYGKTNFKGLYRFITYMDQIRKYEIDDGEAGITSENDDVVRIMTMHGSKGLEFPVCFLAGIERKRNASDERGRIIWNAKCGFGTAYTDLDMRIMSPTLPKIIAREENRLESIAEEMRIFYVAMTRAREKLIMVGSDTKEFSQVPGYDHSSYLGMLKTAYGKEGFEHIDISYVTEEELTVQRFMAHMERESAADAIFAMARDPEQKGDFPLPDYLQPLSFSYPYPIRPDLTAKLSVSELKHRAMKEMDEPGALVQEGERLFGETDPEKYIPAFMRKEGQTATGGTFYGTAFHRIMELWDYPDDPEKRNVTEDDVIGFTEKMRKLHRMDAAEAEAIRPGDVAFFLNSSLGNRMRKAKAQGVLFREQPFVIGVDVDGETILVQGIIDAFFTDDEGITVVDYKTDHVNDETMLINRYRTQLEYYGKALSQITGKKIKALTIYSTRLRKEIAVS
ncbi:MAG: helicase-exonuclease AddAB subunit AddA [Lachnospiraceae bacterium]|nr:helicase-exonuclease AddAB subunit AddA [Lachnospiraceae bacterium]